MICDAKRVAYVRIPPEDLLFSVCQGEKGLYNGRVQTLFLRVRLFIFHQFKDFSRCFF
jgi:hypothetical protein